jgi:hypothetical protein
MRTHFQLKSLEKRDCVCTWEDNIKINFREIKGEGAHWIQVVRDRNQ